MPAAPSPVELYLVPGFMGFDHIALVHYFEGVETFLRNHLRRRGVEVRVIVTTTVPAGALSKRAAKLVEEVAKHHDEACTSVHFLGHSTGGLDVRLMLSPGDAFDPDGSGLAAMPIPELARFRHAVAHTRTAMSLATPHYGTPLANLLLSLGFDRILSTLAFVGTHATSRAIVEDGMTTLGRVSRVLREFGLERGFLEWTSRVVLERPPGSVLDYLASLGEDLGALRNLSQEAASTFVASVVPREGVDYVSFCSGTNESKGPIGTRDPFVEFNTRIFRELWPRVGRRNPAYGYAPDADVAALRARYEQDLRDGADVGRLVLDDRTNDGLVPTFSQVYGRVGGVFASDHVDCIGLFRCGDAPGFVDSGADFGARRFALLWSRVADEIVASLPVPKPLAPAVVAADAVPTASVGDVG